MKKIFTTALLSVVALTMQGQVGSPVYNKLVSNKLYTDVTWDGHGYLVESPVYMGTDDYSGEEIWFRYKLYFDSKGEELFDGGNFSYIEYIPEGNIFLFFSGRYGIAGPRGAKESFIVDPWHGDGYDDITCVMSENNDGSKRWINQYKVKREGFAGVLDSNCREILAPTKYTDAEYDYNRQLFVVEQGEKGGVLDKYGKELVMFPHVGYISTSSGSSWFVFSSEDQKQYLCTFKGKIIWTADDYDILENEDLVPVKKGNLWGYINVNNGQMVIQPQYTSAETFSDGVAKVSKGKESFLITNPLLNGGVSKVLSSLSVSAKSDIDIDIPEIKRVQENTFAVIIANQDYQDFSVPYAQNDGMVFKEYCMKTLGIPKSNVMYYENATLNTIKSAVSRIKDLSDVYDGDAKIIFYFSGQGVCDSKGNPFILPSDGTANMASSTGYALSLLYSEIGSLNTQAAIILLDAGFNNQNREGKVLDKVTGISVKNINPSINGRVVAITASDVNEPALSYQDKSHGLFTYFLCKKIRESKGNVNLQELSRYISSQVSQTASSKTGKSQHPQTKNTTGNSIQLIKL